MNATKTSLVVALLGALSVAPLPARAATAAALSDYSAVFDGPRWGDTTTTPAPGVAVRSQPGRASTTISPSSDGTWPQIGHALPPISLGVYAPPDPEPAILNDGLRQPIRSFAALGARPPPGHRNEPWRAP